MPLLGIFFFGVGNFILEKVKFANLSTNNFRFFYVLELIFSFVLLFGFYIFHFVFLLLCIFSYKSLALLNNESTDERLSALEKRIDALTNLIHQQTQRAPNYFDYNGGHYFQPHHIMPSYYYLGWRTYEDFPYRSQNFQSQGGSSYIYQEQIQQPSDEEMFYAL